MDLVGFATSGCTYEEVGTTGVGGWTFPLSGDTVRYMMTRPSHWDIDNDIFVRVIYATGSTTSADTITWKVLHSRNAFGAAPAAPTTELDTLIAQDTLTGAAAASEVRASPAGKIDASTIVDTSDFLVFDVELDAFAAGLTESKQMLGLEFAYVPKLTEFPQQAPDLQTADPWS